MAQVETASASSASVQDLIDAVETVGFDAAVFDGGSAGGGPHTTRIKIEGMTCGHCTSTCTKALEGVSGVGAGRAAVDLASGIATVTTDAPIDAQELVDAVDICGFDARVAEGGDLNEGDIASIEMAPLASSKRGVGGEEDTDTEKTALLSGGKTPSLVTLYVHGMHCSTCQSWVTSAMSNAAATDDVKIDLQTGKATAMTSVKPEVRLCRILTKQLSRPKDHETMTTATTMTMTTATITTIRF